MATPKLKIALIISSTRTPRVGPPIAQWVTSVLASTVPPIATLETVDLANYPLPLSPSGPRIPANITSPGVPVPKGAYGDPQVDTWSEKVAGYDGFVFVTPQYNWSVPGVLKVSLDHLFHEWAGKPIAIVSYGGRGGGKAAVALTEIWKGLRGGEVVGGVELEITEGMELAQTKGELYDGQSEAWEKAGKIEEVVKTFGQLATVLEGKKKL
jgi:NAD(P)H-dependent FMN reductase